MPGTGTLINCLLVLLGGVIGLRAGSLIPARIRQVTIQACGLSTLFIGSAGALSRMLQVQQDGSLASGSSMLLVICLILGGAIGTLLDIEGRIDHAGQWLRHQSNSDADNLFLSGFTSASFTICIGAMAIIGPLQDVLYHDFSLLITKGILDFIIILSMSASMGRGPVFSVIPLFIWQGFFTLVALIAGPLFSETSLNQLSLVGNVCIFCVGVNLLFDRHLPVANLLPSLLISLLPLPFFA